jgi:hypothetical protein
MPIAKGRGAPRSGEVERECLRCGRPFLSLSRFNRFCSPCAETNGRVQTGRYIVHGRAGSGKG